MTGSQLLYIKSKISKEQSQDMSGKSLRKKVDFFDRCVQLRKSYRRNVSSMYNEFAHIRFFELHRTYEQKYAKNKASDQLEAERAHMIAIGCSSNYEELDRCNKSQERKEKFNKLTDFAQDLAEEKAIKKVMIMNTMGQMQRMSEFHKQLLQGDAGN